MSASFLDLEVHEQFKEALRGRSIVPPDEVIADGELHRCGTEGRDRGGDGAYLLRRNGAIPSGGFMNWRDGCGWQEWRFDIGRALTDDEQEELRQQAEGNRKRFAEETTLRQAAAALRAKDLWNTAKPCIQHPYLTQKDVQPHSVRVSDRGDLVIRLLDDAGSLCSLQLISPDGSKRFLPGGKTRGCYFPIGNMPGAVFLLVEGYATAASVYEATGFPTAAALTAGNLRPVAKLLKSKYPAAQIVICADDDSETPGNPGLTSAREAAAAVNGVVAVPDFGPDRPMHATDFNDLHRHAGIEAVKRCVDAALAGYSARTTKFWAEPDLDVLHLHRRPPPSLSLELFGPEWNVWIAETAEAAACPPDYVAAPLLAAASVLIGNARWAEARPGWAEPPHLWCSVVGDSGTGKSPGSDALLRDILPALEAKMVGEFPDRLRLWRAETEMAKAAEDAWKKAVQSAQKHNKAVPAPPTDEVGPEPQMPRLRQNDVTIEKVGAILAGASPKGVLIVRDELAGWITGMGAYHSGGRAFWLEAYGGREWRIERQKHPEPIVVPHLAVAVYGGVQPDRLSELMEEESDDGLLARILWAWPDPVPFRLSRSAPRIAWATAALDKLRELELLAGDRPAPIRVPLAEEAVPFLETFAQDLLQRQTDAGGLMRSALGKGRGLTLRLSLVLEMLWWCGRPGAEAPPTQITPRRSPPLRHWSTRTSCQWLSASTATPPCRLPTATPPPLPAASGAIAGRGSIPASCNARSDYPAWARPRPYRPRSAF